jgi:hypothetical protein
VRRDFSCGLFDREGIMPWLYEGKESFVRMLLAEMNRERRSRKNGERRTEAESNSGFEKAATAYRAA